MLRESEQLPQFDKVWRKWKEGKRRFCEGNVTYVIYFCVFYKISL